MTHNERMLNRSDLDLFMSGGDHVTTMIPGIKNTGNVEAGQNSRKSGGLLSLEFNEKQKRLQQYGYNKE